MPYPVFSPATIDQGKLYIGCGNGDYVNVGDGGEVRCIDLKNPQNRLENRSPKTVLGAVVVTDDKLYFGCCDGNLYACSRKGEVLEKFDTYGMIKTSPAVTDKNGSTSSAIPASCSPWIGTRSNPFGNTRWAPRERTSVLRWSRWARSSSAPRRMVSSALGSQQPPKPPVPRWTSPGGNANHTGNLDGSNLPDNPEVLWSFPPNPEKLAAPPVKLGLACWGKELFVPVDTVDFQGLVCLPAGNYENAATGVGSTNDGTSDLHPGHSSRQPS